MQTGAMSIPMTAAERFTPFQRWGSVGLMFLAAMVNYIDRGSLSVALPLISADLKFSPSVQGALLSGFFWSYALMQIPVGWAVDRLNAKWVYAGAFALWSLACGLTGFAGSLATLMMVRVLLGIGESAYFPSSTKSHCLPHLTTSVGRAHAGAGHGRAVGELWLRRDRWAAIRSG